jgi:hypothetical protein
MRPKNQRVNFDQESSAQASNNSSSLNDFKMLKKRSQSIVAAELRRVLLAESNITSCTKKSDRRKIGLLELAKEEAQIRETMEGNGDDSPVEEVGCCTSKAKKKKTRREEEDVDDSQSSRLMAKFQKVMKWLVVIIGVSDFTQAIQDVYDILRIRMKQEYFFIGRIYNWYIFSLLYIVLHYVSAFVMHI